MYLAWPIVLIIISPEGILLLGPTVTGSVPNSG